MEIKIVTPKVERYIVLHGLQSKWKKCEALFIENPKHPSLHTELLEPKYEMIFSFRLDRKYRALFMIKNSVAFVFRVTNHYQ
ncbi:hypothetical protein A2641_01840 [Candidatus Nomurabacteria bacterium RIFCSPHIGHO2_01_FULL_37_25]|nr:MAG: hypothetical protein A2641_01840 [Candidatus Nomurabacteria bacterium RIFCSPHIGHO2_01_FULL_37_25]OGI76042.1 MAG: hypothetical protein A3D36_00720 [Candidatus Nomurabacteria bacterium RIFCSPHIGHO2_02_FULL_36_29]OGI96435.1 MAG: hypothetical protein A3I84_00170 [Candidatus Nomurabacteria bacterium RIFCSPLOWO2_02_FULL_36_8]